MTKSAETGSAGRMRRLSGALAAAVLTLLLPVPARADIAAGLADFQRGAFAEAYQQWQEAAEAGDARGALFIGVLYDSGEGVTADPVQALTWYRRAADAGSAAGAFNVAVMYDSGRGTRRDTRQAIKWYSTAADAGYGRADYNLGLIYESGDGVAKDRALALQYYRRAAARGITAAQMHLVSLRVPGVPTRHAVEDTSMQDFAQAQQLLLTRGLSEASHAAELFRAAADRNNALAEYDLGYCYERGLGVPRNLSRADELYRRAASHATDASLRSLAVAAEQSLGNQLTQTTAGSTLSR